MKNTAIQWTDDTHNFWRGCTKVSTGCAHCYAETLVTTRLLGQWGQGAPRVFSRNFRAPIAWNKQPWICDACGLPHAVPGEICMTDGCECETKHRRRVFSLSLGDWLDSEVPISRLAEMLHVIRLCPDLTWQLVTKRPEMFRHRLARASHSAKKSGNESLYHWIEDWLNGDAPQNIWIIASAENQATLDQRAQHLLQIPAAIRGLSCEPLLGPLNLEGVLPDGGIALAVHGKCIPAGPTVDWVIAGGESGPDARHCNIEWIESIVRQCHETGVPCFVKQLGAFPAQDLSAVIPASDITDPNLDASDIGAWEFHRHHSRLHLKDKKGGDSSDWPTHLRVRQFPKAY